MAIRLGSAYGKVELDASGVQQGVATAEKSLKGLDATAKKMGGSFARMTSWIKQNAVAIAAVGDGLQNVGKKMTQFITIPIIGFLALATKKALEADTALSKMAKDSLGKLNEQLAILGEKFLPILIKFVDWLTVLIEKFNNAPPAVQKLVMVLGVLVALAGPMTSFAGSVLTAISTLSSLGITFTSVIPAIVSFGTALWAALLPLLPILALIAAAILLVYLLWSNWDELKVIVSQLAAIIKYELKRELELLSQEAAIFKAKWNESLAVWRSNFKQAGEINQKVHKLAVDAMVKVIVDFATKTNAKLTEIRNWAVNTWNQITSTFFAAFSAISSFFESVKNSIIAGIQAIIDAVNGLIDALASIVLPDELTPGSPTPFEIGLRGITAAMKELSRQAIPEFNRSMAMADIYAARQMAMAPAMRGGGQVIMNNHFASGISVRQATQIADERISEHFGKLSQMLEGR